LLEALAAQDFAQLEAVLDADASMAALVPGGLRECSGAPAVREAFEGWFGATDRFEVTDASVGQIGALLELRWRIQLEAARFGGAVMIVEQHAYACTGPSGRIHNLSLLCSGFWNSTLDFEPVCAHRSDDAVTEYPMVNPERSTG
jgi:hypothetical protein